MYKIWPCISPPQFTLWRVSICILEAEIALGVLYRKGGNPNGGGVLCNCGFPSPSFSGSQSGQRLKNRDYPSGLKFSRDKSQIEIFK